MAASNNVVQKAKDNAIILAWEVLGPGAKSRIFVERFFQRFGLNLARWYEEYVAATISSDELLELIRGALDQADELLPAVSELQREAFHRRFAGNLFDSLTSDDEYPGPQVAQ